MSEFSHWAEPQQITAAGGTVEVGGGEGDDGVRGFLAISSSPGRGRWVTLSRSQINDVIDALIDVRAALDVEGAK